MHLKSMDAFFAVAMLALGLTCAGCGQQSSKTAQGDTADQKQAPRPRVKVVDDITGKTAVDAGKRARATIGAVQAQRNADFEELAESTK